MPIWLCFIKIDGISGFLFTLTRVLFEIIKAVGLFTSIN